MRGGVLQLVRWGLLDAVVAAGTPPVGLTTFRYAHDVVEVAIQIDTSHATHGTVGATIELPIELQEG